MTDDARVRKYLTWAIIIGIGAFAVAALLYVNAYAGSIGAGSYRSFSVNGEGRVTAIPDLVEFSFAVVTQGGADIETLRETNAGKVNSAIEFVKNQGVADEDIKTVEYSLSPRYQSVLCERGSVCPPADIVGYTVRSAVSVKIRDFSKLSGVLTGVIGAGANTVSGVSFTVEDRTELENEARVLAMKEARIKAKTVAKSAGVRIGRLISINEGFYGPYFGRAESAVGFGGDSMAPAPVTAQIEPGSQEIIVNVTLSYELK